MKKKNNKNYRPLLILKEMHEKRILKSIESSKVKINNYLNNEKVEVINDIETQFLKRKLISVNFEDFMKKKINTKNMMHSIIICIISIIGFLRILLGAYTTDPEILVLIADPFYLIGDRVLISVLIALYFLASVKARMTFLLSELKHLNL
jgi:hypothetical protein